MGITDNNIKPIFLFADSQLLFYRNKGKLFLNRINELIDKSENGKEIKAAYIGVSNNDDSQFYDIFEAAMQQIKIVSRKLIKSKPDKADNEFLKSADIILLAGGNTYKGWSIIECNGWNQIIIERYSKGAILIGVSAGAIQLGMKGYQQGIKDNKKGTEFDTLQLVPFIIDVHAGEDWLNLNERIKLENGKLKGYGIPFGAGLIYYPDMSIEAVRSSCTEIEVNNKSLENSIILPPNEGRVRKEATKLQQFMSK